MAKRVNKFEKRILEEEKQLAEVMVEIKGEPEEVAAKAAKTQKKQESVMQNIAQKGETQKIESISAQDKFGIESDTKVVEKGKKAASRAKTNDVKEGEGLVLLDMVLPVDRPMKVTKTFYMDADAFQWLAETAKSRGMNPSQFVNKIIEILMFQEKQTKTK